VAKAVNISRQTVYAIETSKFIPNTAVALKLAKLFGVTVEDLFPPEKETPPVHTEEVSALLPGTSVRLGQPLQLCRVGGRLVGAPPEPGVWGLPAADAIVMDHPGTKPSRKTKVQIVDEGWKPEKRLLIAGCDPGVSVLARHLRRYGIDLMVSYVNSSDALALMKQGLIHIAGSHIRDEKTGQSNLPQIGKLLGKESVTVISFASWEEGIVVAPGNPKGIRSVADLGRPDVTIVNREPGAGCRHLLDALLQRVGLSSHMVKGYDRIAVGHLPSAWQVQAREADCCINTIAAARLFGLDFVPLVSTRYDLVVRKSHLKMPAMESLVETLGRAAFRNELAGFAGYDMKTAGDRLL
jgi:molybdate-binding protein/DNA-binding XRE family transcriptional regulator